MARTNLAGYHGAAAIKLAELEETDPEAYLAKVRAALEKGGSVPKAAKILGVSSRTLLRRVEANKALTKDLEIAGRGWPKGKPRKPHDTTKKKQPVAMK